MIFRISSVKSAVIFGAGHGIGLALLKQLNESNSEALIFATYRNKEKARELLDYSISFPEKIKLFQVNPSIESEIEEIKQSIASQTKSIDLIINSIGFLQDSNMGPEKSLRDINYENLLKSFQINSIITPMIAKHFTSLLTNSEISLLATVSAKVGSIEDNRLGGWYGYRASKAALNMFIKTIAIEYQRNKKRIIVVSLHPGTTITELSKPHIARSKLKLHTPQETAKNLLKVIDETSLDNSGGFYSWDGSELPW